MTGMTPERLASIRRELEDQRYLAESAVDAGVAVPSSTWRSLDQAEGLLAEVDRLRAIESGIEALHRPVHPVFSWKTGLRFEEPCPECHGKAGVHPCGCWADEDTTYECAECAMPKGGGSRRVIPWPCPTAALLDSTEGEDQ